MSGVNKTLPFRTQNVHRINDETGWAGDGNVAHIIEIAIFCLFEGRGRGRRVREGGNRREEDGGREEVRQDNEKEREERSKRG